MKKKSEENLSGIVIHDSITMSVKKKRLNLRKPEAVLIAVIGFVSVIVSFLDMFSFTYSRKAVIIAAAAFSAIYIAASLSEKIALWFAGGSVLVMAAALWRYSEYAYSGFEYMYNIIYQAAHHTQISYFKHIEADSELLSTTVFFIFCIWFISAIVYTFTINRPNPLFVLLATFPPIEIGLYNGIKIPVFWGTLTIAYWLAVSAMFSIDVGEYYGGNGGFIRRDNCFFPKKQMRFKVTEHCALLIMASAVLIGAASSAVMSITGYSRSESLNQKRVDIKEAVNSFTFNDVASSVSRITEAFGFTFTYETQKLGNVDHIKYKNVTDITATFDKEYSGAVYLKGSDGAVYGNNSWSVLKTSVYNNNKSLFNAFKKYDIYPQDFPHIFYGMTTEDSSDITIWLQPKRKKNKSYFPYGINNYGNIEYSNDTLASSKTDNKDKYSYKFTGMDAWSAASILSNTESLAVSVENITDSTYRSQISDICEQNGIDPSDGFLIGSNILNTLYDTAEAVTDGEYVLASLLESNYRTFVDENYLQVPDNQNMDEVREAFSDILDSAEDAQTASEQIAVLDAIRERINSMTEYSLSPGETPSNRDFVNYFLLENHKGYCIHYATAGVILARMAGIPARYATGYIVVGDDFNESSLNEDGTYTINIEDNRSHAWAEIYLDGFGWVPYEFTAGFSGDSIDIPTETESTDSADATATTESTDAESEASTENKTESTESSSSEITVKPTENQDSSTVALTTNVPSDEKTNGLLGSGIGGGLSLGAVRIIIAAGIIILILLLIYLRRCIIIKHRKKQFTCGPASKRIGFMYAYAERILAFMKITRGNLPYMEFADYVEKALVPEYFHEGSFLKFTETALENSFGSGKIDGEEVREALEFTKILSSSVYRKSGFLKRMYLRIVLVLI